MVKNESLLILKTTSIARDTIEMILRNEYISRVAEPGQFIHIQVPGFTLRRPISITQTNRPDQTVTIVFKMIGEGMRTLGRYTSGMVIQALGPNGNGFPQPKTDNGTILLVGGGVGIPPLHFLGKTLSEQTDLKIISVLGFQSESFVFYEETFKTFGETHIVTNDGSYGHKGFVTNLLGHVDDFSEYFTCGPLPMLKAVTEQLKDKPGYISLEERMGCGVGACFACVMPTDDGGYRKICQDGPVFRAGEVNI